jgi:hypothetical protein
LPSRNQTNREKEDPQEEERAAGKIKGTGNQKGHSGNPQEEETGKPAASANILL